jgi:hypothetical protein
MCRYQFLRPAHVGFLQMIGCVYLNCCSVGSCSVKQSMHLNCPVTSSGRTSDVRVTVPAISGQGLGKDPEGYSTERFPHG